MKNYVGRKCRGFRFEDRVDGVRWGSDMSDIIGQVGEVVAQGENHVNIKFNNCESWLYPISLIEEHLIPETPEIPQLGEGIEMEVSNDNISWHRRKVIAQMDTGLFITNGGLIWDYARPIQEVKKYTKEELVKIVGHDFEII
jgi:hypothetical protein